ncbi:MAG: Fur family transcriptional regulator [bacterium]|nr:Fur family transcriptional regulator [bacterium]MCY4258114.1 Fur family transcriptional regulator [bacterium]
MGLQLVDTHHLVASRLREAGQVYTKGRRELVELLLHAGRPATVPEMMELHPRLTQSSLYRNMADLENLGIVRRVAGVDDQTRYEFTVEIIGQHHHTICTVCGGVADFFIPATAEYNLETALDEALSTTGFQTKSHRLDVFGTCPDCS